MKKILSVFLLLALGIGPVHGFSIPGGNASGVNRFFLMPALDQAKPLTIKSYKAKLDLAYTNEFASMESKDYKLLADMECFQATLGFSAGFFLDSEISADATFLSYSGGFLDSFLGSYHDALGVGNYGRSVRPDNEFGYQIWSGGQGWFKDSGEDSGLADIRLGLKKLVYSNSWMDASIKGVLKLPTGDPDKVFGTGGADTQVLGLVDLKPHNRVTVSLAGGHTWLSRPDFLEGMDIGFSDTWFGGLGLAYQLTEALSGFVQSVYWESPYGTTGIPVLDRDYGEITFGGKYQWKSGWAATVALSEDLSRSASDFTFHTGVEKAF
ncbi:MAG: DUF3187 family protein [Desulfatibacillum sp.]|nr:DUF3187 family protein [Desulfatibacillum sp.]